MLQLGESENRILDALETAKPKGLLNQDLLKIQGMFPSNLSKFLKRLQNSNYPLVRRDVKTRRYHILEVGEEALGTRDDIAIISRTARSFSGELDPSNEKFAPQILPVEASIYLNLQIATDVNAIATEQEVSKLEAQEQVLAELAENTANKFEQMLVTQFHLLADEQRIHQIQQMSVAERDKYFRGWIIKGKKVALDGGTVARLEEYYMNQKIPKGGPDLSLEKLFSFEAALVVKVSHAKIMKDLQGVKNRLVMRILADINDPDLYKDPDQVLPVMSSLGLITPDELQEYKKVASTKRGRERFLSKLWDTYYEKAWHKKYEKPRHPIVSWHKAVRQRLLKLNHIESAAAKNPTLAKLLNEIDPELVKLRREASS